MDTDTEVQANLKIPKSLKEKLKEAAKENHRSMTAEVVARLQESFEPNLAPADIVRLRRTSDVSALESRDIALLEEMMAILIEKKIDERLGKIPQEKHQDE